MWGVKEKFSLVITAVWLYYMYMAVKDDTPRTTTVQLKPGLRPILQTIADDEDRSLSYIINRYLERGLRADGYLPSGSDDGSPKK
jgi:hypothetical protein